MQSTQKLGTVQQPLLWFTLAVTLGLCHLPSSRADGPRDNDPTQVRSVPPVGLELTENQTTSFASRISYLKQRIEKLPSRLRNTPAFEATVVTIRSVEMTIKTSMFYKENDIKQAFDLLDEAERRITLLTRNTTISDTLLADVLGVPQETLSTPTPVAGGFKSKIDDSFQPYGLVLPAGLSRKDWDKSSAKPLRLDVWLHGRGESVSEAAFMNQCRKQVGQYTPANTIVLHPYGRYCNAFKFAGEIDVLEAIDHVKQFLPIDESRITIRGFSMGGAGCWQLAVHYPDLWAAANPGAGFCETTEFLRVFQSEAITPTPYQRALLQWYDCPGWINNLRNVPTVAYSGEIDRQKQAADVMEAAYASRGMTLPHVIGPDTAHKIHPDSKIEIENFLGGALLPGKPDVPTDIDLTTYTLRYHKLGWLSIEGIEKHWSEARVQGKLSENAVSLKTQNVTHLQLNFAIGEPFQANTRVDVKINDEILSAVVAKNRQEWTPTFSRNSNGDWQETSLNQANTQLRKRPGLQGPIDDAFMDRFAFVPPKSATGKKTNIDHWVEQEYQHATGEWLRHYRGDIVELDANDSPPTDVAQNFVLFGTPATNPWIAQVIDQLPITWTANQLLANGTPYSAENYVPVLIYPSPWSQGHYVVLNSGFTFREYAYLNNARQVPMLPDWAVVDVTTGATSQLPGKVVSAGFFNESWQFSDE